MEEILNFIGGEWIEGENTFLSYSPLTNENIYKVHVASDKNVNSAVKSALSSFILWKETALVDRIKYFQKAIHVLSDKENKANIQFQEEIVLSIMEDVGKPRVEAETELLELIDILEYYTSNIENIIKPKVNSIDPSIWKKKKSYTFFEPRGVVGIIKSWNYPFSNPCWSIIPAMISGNTIIFKPSEFSCKASSMIGKLFERVDLPKGVLNILFGKKTVGNSIVENQNIKTITFTGSIPVGNQIRIKCAALNKRCSLELGGNDVAIVLDDANIDLAVNGIIWGGISNAGQVCTGTKRIFVDEKVITLFQKKLLEKVILLKRNKDIGNVISPYLAKQIISYIEQAKQVGGKVITGGKILDDNFVEPTIIVDCNDRMDLMTEEVFGPILPVFCFKNIEKVINTINAGLFGLGASVWTNNLELGLNIAHKIKTGMVWINEVNLPFPQAPWGGVKQSGEGTELSEFGIYKFMNLKHICIDSSNKDRDWWFPYNED